MKRTTIKDLSKALGVHISTVSRALADHQDISKEVKEKVKQLAEAMNYFPNQTAVHLKTNSSKQIGVIIPQISTFFIPKVIQGITNELNLHQYSLTILCTNNNFDLEKKYIQQCCYSMMDGVLLSVTSHTENLDHLDLAKKIGLPIVLFDKIIEDSTISTVHIDEEKASFDCINFLIENKCKNVLGVFAEENLGITKVRRMGVQNAIRENGRIFLTSIYSANIIETKQKTIQAILDNKQIDGIFCISDEARVGAMAALDELQLLEKIKIVSFSDGVLTPYQVPKSAYVYHNGEDIGQKAAQVLLHQIKNKNDFSVEQYILPTQFIRN
jgi:LacI family transcriptional regulator